MNEQQQQQGHSIGLLMKAARKFKKFNQSDVAQAIGCSQSALSKMEHNLLIPDAPQWFLFSRFTSIPPETIETGIIDRHTRVKLNNDEVSLGFKIPKRYRLNRAQKVREVYPFLFYLEKNIGGEIFTQFMESVGIDKEFFLDYDNLVNFQLIVDLVNLYIRIGKDSEADIQDIVTRGQNDLYWDQYMITWRSLKDAEELLQEFAGVQPFFQGDFSFKVEKREGTLQVAFIPEPHLYHFLKDLGPDAVSWLTTYRKHTLQNLVKKVLGKDIEARAVSDIIKSPLESRFEIR
jgi:transcriptional regulator with XRE-family HTH domain